MILRTFFAWGGSLGADIVEKFVPRKDIHDELRPHRGVFNRFANHL
jgi:hypothetical protein